MLRSAPARFCPRFKKRTPKVAHRKTDSGYLDLPLEDVRIGDTLVILPHEIVPVDGTVVEGHGRMDESYLTGEPFEISKAPGSTVLSGAINKEQMRCASRTLQDDHIVRVNGAQRAEVRVAMRGDSDVAAAGGKRGPGNVSRPLDQDSHVIALKDHDCHLQARDLDLGNHCAVDDWRFRRRASDGHHPAKPFFRAALRESPFAKCARVPRQDSSAPDHEGAAEPTQPSPPWHGRLRSNQRLTTGSE
jgi:hypothetical protein